MGAVESTVRLTVRGLRGLGVRSRDRAGRVLAHVLRSTRRRYARARGYARRTFLLPWCAAALAIVIQLLAPMALLYLWLKAPAVPARLPDTVLPYATVLMFMASYGCIMLLGTVASIILKAAIKGYSSGARSLIVFLMSIGLYLFVAFMGAVVGREAPKLPGEIPVLLTFYIALYVMFSGWTTKHIWDRVTDDGRDRLLSIWSIRASPRRERGRTRGGAKPS